MLIIIDHKMSREAKLKLSDYGALLELQTTDIVYPAISGHPDIFFCKIKENLFSAHNIPLHYINKIRDFGVSIVQTSDKLGEIYPKTARFNAIIEHDLFIHNHKITATSLLQNADNYKKIFVKQGYARCNTIILNNTHCLTSDKSIETALINNGINTLYIKPDNIELNGFKHGFFGGCCGVLGNKLFINGSLSMIPSGELIKEFVPPSIEIIELSSKPLNDVGSILFVE